MTVHSLSDVRKAMVAYDDHARQFQECPVEKRQQEMHDKREERRRKERQARAQQQATNGWENWYAAIDQRISEHFRQRFERDAEGNVGPLTAAIGDALGGTRAKMRKEFETAIEKLRGDLNKLSTEMALKLGRPPLVKRWERGVVFYTGDLVTCDGSCFQAQTDTCQRPDQSADWVCIARGGKDGRNGRTPRLRGAYDVREKYAEFDIVQYDSGTFIATRDDLRTVPGEEGWQCLALPGGRGPEGAVGPRGQRGARGEKGEAAPEIIGWVLDRARYTAHPTMSNGKAGPPLELRSLFEQFIIETGLGT